MAEHGLESVASQKWGSSYYLRSETANHPRLIGHKLDPAHRAPVAWRSRNPGTAQTKLDPVGGISSW